KNFFGIWVNFNFFRANVPFRRLRSSTSQYDAPERKLKFPSNPCEIFPTQDGLRQLPDTATAKYLSPRPF
ncbi:MAG: hypothetical protein LBI01_04450, partial [Elusimicrobium sp.]|nr:hypothetical protein [Elusimicrobium sp.]